MMDQADQTNPRLNIQLLGPWQVLVDDRPVETFKYDKVRALLAFLVMETGRPHRRERLAGLLWPDRSDVVARDGLRQALATLRQAIGDRQAQPPHLFSSRDTLAFNLDSSYQVDAGHFQELVETSQRHRHRRLAGCPECLARLARGVDLYQGEFLAHFSLSGVPEFEGWLTGRREYLHRLALESLEVLAEHTIRQGEWSAAQAYARRQLVLEPWRETAHRQLMLALARDGQRPAALAQFNQCRLVLEAELAVEPESATLALVEQIRLGTLPPAKSAGSDLLLAPAYRQLDLVGRQEALGELRDLVTRPETRLLTVTGPGGVGKTHLAAVLAEQVRPYFADGVAMVTLAPLEHIGQLPAAMAAAIGLRFQGPQPPERQLLDFLSTREMLLLLDNFEHLVGEPTLLADLSSQAPGLVLLVTSRHRLKLRRGSYFPCGGCLIRPGIKLGAIPGQMMGRCSCSCARRNGSAWISSRVRRKCRRWWRSAAWRKVYRWYWNWRRQ
jgi:DNA-binding SARP family transcriptional activator